MQGPRFRLSESEYISLTTSSHTTRWGGPEEVEWLSEHSPSGRCPPPPNLRELTPGELCRPVGLHHDGGVHFAGLRGAAGLAQKVVVRLVAGVQAAFTDLLVEAGV